MTDLGKQRMSDAKDAEPVIEGPKRPMMGEKPPRPRRIGGELLRMSEDPEPPRGKANRMKASPSNRGKPRAQRTPLPDQVEKKPASLRSAAVAEEESYIRMRVRIEDGEMSVQSIKAVEGPLIPHEDLHGDLAYEVAVGEKRVSSGPIPDVGINRSFPHPDPAPGQEGHHIATSPTHEFIARVPGADISLKSLPRVNLRLFRIKEGPLPKAEGVAPLGQHFDKELREVSSLRGIKLEDLPKAAQAEARRALR